MQCKEVQLELAAYLSGELPAEEMAAVKAHLSQCEACAEEAAIMDPLRRKLSEGLKLWVDQGVCPPEVMERIEQSLHQQARRRPKWLRPGFLAVAAVAAVFMVALAGARMELPAGQLASLPLVGSLAAQLLGDDKHDLDDLGAQAVPINRSAEVNGVKLTVQRLLSTPEATTIQYSLDGAADAGQPELKGSQGVIPLERISSRQSGGQLVVTAQFAPVPAHAEVTLTVQGVSVTFATP